MKEEKPKVNYIFKNTYNVTLAMGVLIVLLNLIYFIAFNDPFCNRNTTAGILIIIASFYMKEKSKRK